jgi:hypothetical protein
MRIYRAACAVLVAVVLTAYGAERPSAAASEYRQAVSVPAKQAAKKMSRREKVKDRRMRRIARDNKDNYGGLNR